jgi:hypothetical protein
MSGRITFRYTCCEALDYYFLSILNLGKTKLIPGSEAMNQALTGHKEDGVFLFRGLA